MLFKPYCNSGEFNPDSLGGFFDDGSLESLTNFGNDMDLGEEEEVCDFSDLPKLPPRKSVFPDHPGRFLKFC